MKKNIIRSESYDETQPFPYKIGRYLSFAEKYYIMSAYLDNQDIKSDWQLELATELGRPRLCMMRYAKKLGLTSKYRKWLSNRIYIRICTSCGNSFSSRSINRKVCNMKCSGKSSSKRIKQYYKTKGHPKGMLGKHHSQEYREKFILRIKQMWMGENSVMRSEKLQKLRSDTMQKRILQIMKENPENMYSRTIKGWREFGDGKKYYFKSKWEMNYAYYLEFLKKQKQITDWQYEAKTFWFEKIKRGVRSYTPDFLVTTLLNAHEYHEVKGWMDSRSATKLKRMKIYFPKEKLILIDEDQYKTLKRQIGRLCKWE